MNPLALELTKLIGKKELSFGCIVQIGMEGTAWYDGESTVYDSKLYYFISHEIEYVDGSIGKEKLEDLFIEIENDILYNKEGLEWLSDNSEYSVDEILGHPATLTDFHRWMNEKKIRWNCDEDLIYIKIPVEPHPGRISGVFIGDDYYGTIIPYDSSKELLEQETSTLEQIVELVKTNSSLIRNNQ